MMPGTALLLQPKTKLSVETYPLLREAVRQTLLEGQLKIEQAKVQTYWQSGKYIQEHILLNQDRAGYGDQIVVRLSEDLEIDLSVLKKIRRFYRFFQKGSTWSLLSWGHYRALLAIEDEKRRYELADLAEKNKWIVRDLEIRVRNECWRKQVEDSEGKEVPRLPFVCLGPFYTYRIVKPETIHSRSQELLIDFGFSHSAELSLYSETRFGPDTLVTSAKDARGRYVLEKVTNSNDLLYTFKAYVERVIDGDTLKVEFELGFGQRHHETIRLRCIDCPEINTPEGKAAKRFVENQLKGVDFITVKSVQTKREKWGRYLGDVFFGDKPVYLNQLLLDKGHAVRVRN
ncbi:MAG: DUF1016 family protein [Candidatus Omnitrophica bacterium]|nr:DUF1016 family protein [Candidatus Omnitrophota bacterium]